MQASHVAMESGIKGLGCLVHEASRSNYCRVFLVLPAQLVELAQETLTTKESDEPCKHLLLALGEGVHEKD